MKKGILTNINKTPAQLRKEQDLASIEHELVSGLGTP